MVFHSGVLSSNIGRSISNERNSGSGWHNFNSISNQNENVSFNGNRTGNGRNLAGMGFRSTGRGGVSLNHNNGNISAELKHILASNNNHSRKIRNNLSFNHVMNNNSPQFQSSFGNG